MTMSFIIQYLGWQAKRGFGATCPKSTFSGHVPEQGIDLPFLRTVSAGMQRVPRVPLGMRISLGSNLLKVPVLEIGHKLMPHSIPHARLLSFRWE
jgi:hypothetical protein